MPPKKGKQVDNSKAKLKKAQKSAEDKTFGLKNKNKSKKVQQFVNQVQGQVSEAQRKKEDAAAKKALAEKKAAEAAKLEAAKLFQPVLVQKVPFGVDPKSILCIYVKQKMTCPKGAKKCKFSHDINVERKSEKIDLYSDGREQKEVDTMENWDEAKLRSVILSKHGNPKTTTDKICKHFIEAVENGKYGWLWICPNGGNECKYRHSLPPGFVLKTKEQKRLEKLALEQQPKITLEDFIETERGKLSRDKLTPITLESFAKWKKTHNQRLQSEKEKQQQLSNGKKVLTGREFVIQRFADKFYKEEENENDRAFDLSTFKRQTDDEENGEVKDYGDGSTAFAQSQFSNSTTEKTEKPQEILQKGIETLAL
ncbi:hypothetical protein PACTADRAFT_49450 [Pachysolen tannophilus NRRL Y-2460]|uniref:C3H1-type domain-containing protein n=1 Tax=Pachysolen tannophilus NRRL Y-2460 TaxID=669874 RepID=A0A1E4TWA1_PACTA|nr:hypothetical protein PACTADRAFT_49450 [Pachysolen tannophilus NRRL Y-2460]